MSLRSIAAAVAIFLFLNSCGPSRSSSSIPKMIVLGVDGMDPAFVERHWSALPNLSRLRNSGSFMRLGTTTPPQSPVAWSTFITGLEPREHGIFDFVHRNAATLQPFSSISRTDEPRFVMPFGDYLLPLTSSHVVSLRKGTPFWETLHQHGIPVTVIRMPTNYPPVNAGKALSGMGTPDLRGTLGTFSFYTDNVEELPREVAGGRIIKVHVDHGEVTLPIAGPPDDLRKDHPFVSVNLTVNVDREQPVARLSVGSDSVVLRQGEWSRWMVAEFPLIPHVSSVHGIFRVLAKQLHPGLEFYVSPVNVDPFVPALPISTPDSWSRSVAEEAGRYFTMGTPEDTSALRQHVLTLKEFQQQTRLVFEEERELLRYSLRQFNEGLLFFYFSSVDQNSHMLWDRYEPELLDVYRSVDECIGEVMRKDPDAELIVMSDHGFARFDRAVHLNTWLRRRGFLSIRAQAADQTSLDSVDWASTEAYALGLNGLYLNVKGRELHGIVDSGKQSRATLANLSEQLLAWHDPVNGRQVVSSVYATNAALANSNVAPDLIVGYSRGYRASWQTGLGGAAAEEIEDNNDPWIGDHCMNAADVPGVLFTTRRIDLRNPKIQDVTTSILKFFSMPGTSHLTNERSFYR